MGYLQGAAPRVQTLWQEGEGTNSGGGDLGNNFLMHIIPLNWAGVDEGHHLGRGGGEYHAGLVTEWEVEDGFYWETARGTVQHQTYKLITP